MATFGLVHGAFHGGWCFDLLRPHLEARGHRVVAPDLPVDDPAAGNARYAEVACEAFAGAGDLVVVGHSLGGLAVPLVAARVPVRRMVFLCAFLPRPGLPFTAQFDTEEGMFPPSTEETWPVQNEDGSLSWPIERSRPALYPDVPDAVVDWLAPKLRVQWRTPHTEPCPLDGWPDAPSSYVLALEDTQVGAEWARRTARERLHTTAVELPGGHSPFLARPEQLAAVLDGIAAEG